MPGTGDMWSTTSDLNRCSDAVRLRELLTPQMTAAMLTSHATARDVVGPRAVVVPRGYGYRCFLGTVCGQTAHFHPGDNPGYQSLHASVPAANVSIALLSNYEATHPDDVLRPLCATLFGA